MVNFSLCIFHHKQNNKWIFLKTEKYSINLENWLKFQVQQSSVDLGKHGSIFIHFMIKQIEALRKAYASQSLGLFLYLKTHFFLFFFNCCSTIVVPPFSPMLSPPLTPHTLSQSPHCPCPRTNFSPFKIAIFTFILYLSISLTGKHMFSFRCFFPQNLSL